MRSRIIVRSAAKWRQEEVAVRLAIGMLREARQLLAQNDAAPQLQLKVRSAIKSAEGALRHAWGHAVSAEIAEESGRRRVDDAVSDAIGDKIVIAVPAWPEGDAP